MFCQNCGNQVPDGTGFCPYCGTDLTHAAPAQNAAPSYEQPAAPRQPAQGYQQPAQGYQQPAQGYQPYGQGYNDPYNSGYYQPQRADDSQINSAKTLGIVAIVAGLFIPLVGYICGGIGLSKARKQEFFADATQKEAISKSKTLCIVGIVLAAVSNVLVIILNAIANS